MCRVCSRLKDILASASFAGYGLYVVVMRTSCVAPSASAAMAPPRQADAQTRLEGAPEPTADADVIRGYLRWCSVNAQLNACASVHNGNFSTLAVAALITAAPTSTPEHGTLPHPASPECERAVIQQRGRDGFRTPRAQTTQNRTAVFGSTSSSSALITVAAASTPTYSPPPPPRSSTLRVSDLRAQLYNVAAARIAALARGRAARAVAHDARSLSLARRFRATPLRSIAATDIARVARSFLSRRHFGRRGEYRAAAAAAADAAADATSTSATPISAKPATRRGRPELQHRRL